MAPGRESLPMMLEEHGSLYSGEEDQQKLKNISFNLVQNSIASASPMIFIFSY